MLGGLHCADRDEMQQSELGKEARPDWSCSAQVESRDVRRMDRQHARCDCQDEGDN
jgi:hypothetical protein